uniref:Uncharacterized protein n=2 Tax=Anguilla anguilla TaxID=7936 RepID=A0A0E9VX16_ANGAN
MTVEAAHYPAPIIRRPFTQMQTLWQCRLSPHCTLVRNEMVVRTLIHFQDSLLMSSDF